MNVWRAGWPFIRQPYLSIGILAGNLLPLSFAYLVFKLCALCVQNLLLLAFCFCLSLLTNHYSLPHNPHLHPTLFRNPLRHPRRVVRNPQPPIRHLVTQSQVCEANAKALQRAPLRVLHQVMGTEVRDLELQTQGELADPGSRDPCATR